MQMVPSCIWNPKLSSKSIHCEISISMMSLHLTNDAN